MAQSQYEWEFELLLKADGIPYEDEYEFDPARNSKFDFAFPSHKIAVELEGGIYKKTKTKSGKIIVGGRHNIGKGYEDDCEKYNRATMLGWKVYRIPSNWFRSRKYIYIEKLLKYLKTLL